MADRRPINLPVSIADARQPSETLIATVGAYVVVLTTTLPDAGITVTSTYIGHDGADTQAAHLLLAPGCNPASETASWSEHSIPVTHAHRLCLTDHATVLLTFLRELGQDARIDVNDAAVELDV